MLLAIDVDFENTVCGIFENNKLLTSFSLKTDVERTAREISLTFKIILMDREINLEEIDKLIISVTVPDLKETYKELPKDFTTNPAIFVSSSVKAGLKIKCKDPKNLDPGRITRASAATNKYDENIIMIYASTITVVDFINNKKELMGGLMLPGIDLFKESLYSKSSEIPKLEIVASETIVGNDNEKAFQNGIYHGYYNAVLGIVKDIMKENSLTKDNTKILVAGIYGKFLENNEIDLIYEKNLGLCGLNIINNLNK